MEYLEYLHLCQLGHHTTLIKINTIIMLYGLITPFEGGVNWPLWELSIFL